MESVVKNSEGERAGLAEGDIILSWSRGDAKGDIESPFDLVEIEVEQDPRGLVTLKGTRGGAKHTWSLGEKEGGWQFEARPNLPESLLAIYRNGKDLAKTGKRSEEAARWREAAAETQKYQCSWLSSWFLLQAARALTAGPQHKDSDALYQAAMEESMAAGPEITAQILEAWGLSEEMDDLANAEKHFRQALEIREEANPGSLAVAESLESLFIVVQFSDSVRAEEYLRQALAITETLAPESLLEAQRLTSIAGFENLANVEHPANVEVYYHRALAIQERLVPDSLLVAQSLDSLGMVAFAHAPAEAEVYFRRALAIREKLGRHVAKSLVNLGNLAQKRGDLVKAENYYHQALATAAKQELDSSHDTEGSDLFFVLFSLKSLALERGDVETAREFEIQIENNTEQGRDAFDTAWKLSTLGHDAYSRGDLLKAQEYLVQALALERGKLAPDVFNVTIMLTSLAHIAKDRGDLAKSEGYDGEALAIAQKGFAGISVPDILVDLADTAGKQNDLAKSEEYYRQALALTEKREPGSLQTARILSALGDVFRKRDEPANAEDYYRRALDIERKIFPDSMNLARALAALAGIMRDRQQLNAAAQLYAQAIEVLERQVAHLGGSTNIRAGFRAKHTDYYSDYAHLLLTQKQPDLAFQVIERSRARTLLELLTETHLDIRQGADPALLERKRKLQLALTAKSNRRISLLEGKHTDEEVAAFNKDIDALLSQYREVEGQIRTSSPGYASLTQPQPLSGKEVQQQLLDADTVLLEYALGEKRSFVFVLTPDSLDSYELPKRSEIEDAAYHLYELLTSRNRWIEGETSSQRKERIAKSEAEYQKTAGSLSQTILGPVATRLGVKRLLIVADGALQYVPFAVLPVAGNTTKPLVPLVAEHEIVNLPSASVLSLLRKQANGRRAGPKEVAVLADPVFDEDDPRVHKVAKNMHVTGSDSAKESIPSFSEQLTRSLGDIGMEMRAAGSALPRLSFSRREADAIMTAASPGLGMEALDFQASRETAESKDLSEYRIVHFATHGLLDNERPELSGLVLSLVNREGKPQDGFLDLEDVYNLTLPADLVVLSACETGLGKQITGEGLVGLTRGFMYAGASRVVASLWKVDDVATAELMGRFYRGMLKEGLRPAAALRQAQMEMQKQRRWNDPYYWAAFTLQGEWQ